MAAASIMSSRSADRGTLGKSINAARIGGSIHVIGFVSSVAIGYLSFLADF